MNIQHNISLKPYNTFGIDVSARSFTSFSTVDELEEIFFTVRDVPTLVIGGGSNILFTKNIDGNIAKNEISGIELIREDEEHVYIKSGAGESWHGFVMFCVKKNLGGVENLSLIPGNVGASPMQNIGAYGVEIKDVFYELEAWHIEDKKTVIFSKDDCEFDYRESIFKKKYKRQFVITSVTFRLNKKPVFNTTYGAIQQELDKMNLPASIKNISDIVVKIRQSKLPDPKVIGNAGSFFKNPTIPQSQYRQLKEKFPELVAYPAKEEMKLAAGWLIEQCGWKGYRKGDAGCHSKQALVLVNYNAASGIDIFSLSAEIMASVQEKFGVVLEREVNII